MTSETNTHDIFLDTSRATRQGEELDEARLSAYLDEHLAGFEGTLSSEQFPAGFSNLTYLLRAGDKEYVLRRPPFGARVKTAHDMAREYKILTHLHPVYKKVPRPLIFCKDESVIGAPFYLMERVTGVILRARPPAGLTLSTDVMQRLSKSFIANLAEIHSVDCKRAGLEELGQPHGYASRQIEGWTRRYTAARTDDVPSIERLAAWLAEHTPPDSERSALIHNDYKYDNLVLAPGDLTKIIAVLDWEMATIGDPLMDLGTTLGYWVDADDPEEWQSYGFGLTTLSGNLSRREMLDYYAQMTGREIADAVFYYAYGLLKIAVIVQQIYYRYRQGLTKDPRFATLLNLVKACGNLGERAIEKNRIDRLG